MDDQVFPVGHFSDVKKPLIAEVEDTLHNTDTDVCTVQDISTFFKVLSVF